MECILSVIVTSYNYERFIEKNLSNLVSQSKKNFEIIIVDDGSKDNSVNIIKEFIYNYKNIKLFQHQDKVNKGLIPTVQLALKNASGKYVAFCESDDFWAPTHVENLLNFIEKHPNAELLFNEIVCINNSSYKNYDSYVLKRNDFLKKNNNKNIFEYIFFENLMPTFSSSCVKKDILESCNFNSPIFPYLDFWLWRQLCFTKNIWFVKNCITFWNKHNNSYDMTHNVSNIDDFLYKSNDLIIKKYASNEYKNIYNNEINKLENISKKIELQHNILKYIHEKK